MEDFIEFDLDLLGKIDFDLDLDDIAGGSSEAPRSGFSSVIEIEKFLLEENHDADQNYGAEEGVGIDFSELLANGSKMEAEDEDPITKKRSRQMRNRDSAMKSRERRKSYIKDLEMKSKYLESECRRLFCALSCFEAENAILRQRLQKERPLGALGAKQESAVLFVESLLLGSLFWLVSVVCLLLLPRLPISNQNNASRPGRDLAREVGGIEIPTMKGVGLEFDLELVAMRRRCRGTRTRMKMSVLPLDVLLF